MRIVVFETMSGGLIDQLQNATPRAAPLNELKKVKERFTFKPLASMVVWKCSA